jgi:hypothetical protein
MALNQLISLNINISLWILIIQIIFIKFYIIDIIFYLYLLIKNLLLLYLLDNVLPRCMLLFSNIHLLSDLMVMT